MGGTDGFGGAGASATGAASSAFSSGNFNSGTSRMICSSETGAVLAGEGLGAMGADAACELASGAPAGLGSAFVAGVAAIGATGAATVRDFASGLGLTSGEGAAGCRWGSLVLSTRVGANDSAGGVVALGRIAASKTSLKLASPAAGAGVAAGAVAFTGSGVEDSGGWLAVLGAGAPEAGLVCAGELGVLDERFLAISLHARRGLAHALLKG